MPRLTLVKLEYSSGRYEESECDQAGYDNVITAFNDMDDSKYNDIDCITIKYDTGTIPSPLPINLTHIEFNNCPEYNKFSCDLPETLLTLIVKYCFLHELPKLPKGIKYLDCKGNCLDILPELPDNLIYLNCGSNNIRSLPNLPNGLEVLYCSYNKIRILPKLPNKLRVFFAGHNLLEEFPEPYNLKPRFSLSNVYTNPIKDRIDKHYNGSVYCYVKAKLKVKVKIIENWFLDCKYNPTTDYCRKRLKLEYEYLYDN